MDELYDYINLYYNGVLEYDNPNAVGITGDVIDYITHISVNGCDYCISWEGDTIWAYLESENSLLEIFYPTDINNDENWDVLDILLTINFIMDQIEPTLEQSFFADMNQDGIIDILDIIIMVNFILLS